MTNPAWLLLGTSAFKWIPPPIAFVRRISKLYSSSGYLRINIKGWQVVSCRDALDSPLRGSGTLAGPWVAGCRAASCATKQGLHGCMETQTPENAAWRNWGFYSTQQLEDHLPDRIIPNGSYTVYIGTEIFGFAWTFSGFFPKIL